LQRHVERLETGALGSRFAIDHIVKISGDDQQLSVRIIPYDHVFAFLLTELSPPQAHDGATESESTSH
jgi:hypothetical protein